VACAENVEDFDVLFLHVLDCLGGQVTSDSMATISWIDREDFPVNEAVDVGVESEDVKLRVDEVHQTHDFLELLVVSFGCKAAGFSVGWLEKYQVRKLRWKIENFD
jgi:hypothetical protein